MFKKEDLKKLEKNELVDICYALSIITIALDLDNMGEGSIKRLIKRGENNKNKKVYKISNYRDMALCNLGIGCWTFDNIPIEDMVGTIIDKNKKERKYIFTLESRQSGIDFWLLVDTILNIRNKTIE